VHWVAVPEALRARRVNRAALQAGVAGQVEAAVAQWRERCAGAEVALARAREEGAEEVAEAQMVMQERLALAEKASFATLERAAAAEGRVSELLLARAADAETIGGLESRLAAVLGPHDCYPPRPAPASELPLCVCVTHRRVAAWMPPCLPRAGRLTGSASTIWMGRTHARTHAYACQALARVAMLESGVGRDGVVAAAAAAGSPPPSMLSSYGLGALESAAEMATAVALDAATAAGDALGGARGAMNQLPAPVTHAQMDSHVRRRSTGWVGGACGGMCAGTSVPDASATWLPASGVCMGHPHESQA
jgi:hypothetical protein